MAVRPAPAKGNHVPGLDARRRNVPPPIPGDVVAGQRNTVTEDTLVPVDGRPILQRRVHTLSAESAVEVNILPVDILRPRLHLRQNLRKQHRHSVGLLKGQAINSVIVKDVASAAP